MNFIRMLFSFRGRIDRGDYFLSLLTVTAIPAMTTLILALTGLEADTEKGEPAGYLAFPILIALFWMLLAAMTKRFHDVNWSGWSCLLVLVPVIGGFATLALLFVPGTKGDNTYGYPPP